jgi:hypothetical protein
MGSTQIEQDMPSGGNSMAVRGTDDDRDLDAKR